MSLSSLSSSALRKAAALIEKRDALIAAVAQLNKEIDALASGGSAPAPKKAAAKSPAKKAAKKTTKKAATKTAKKAVKKAAASKPTGPKKGSRRGKVKAAIIKQLKAAGKKGTSVKVISANLKTKPANVHAWFHSTGKKIKEVEKLEGANYRWNA